MGFFAQSSWFKIGQLMRPEQIACFTSLDIAAHSRILTEHSTGIGPRVAVSNCDDEVLPVF
jgi:hypothetical protein